MGLNINLTIKSGARPEEIQSQVSQIIQSLMGTTPMVRLSVLNNRQQTKGAIGEMQQNNIQYNRPWEK